MINAQSESMVSLADAAKILPARRRGKRPHVSCLYRWTISGCKGVVLESIQIGGTRCTSREALSRFFEALSLVAMGRHVAGASLAQRDQARKAADLEIRVAGI